MQRMTTPGLSVPPSRRPAELREAEVAENFPVALRVLPRTHRRHLSAVYDVLRVVDDLGDEAVGDRTQLLQDFAADLARIWDDGRPEAPVLQRLAPTVRELDLPRAEFDRIVAANLQDQVVTEYATTDELHAYCRLSADPVGRLVLHVFGQYDDRAARSSDRICTALQLIEHCQDVGEDRRAGRVYLPRQRRDAFGVAPADLDAPVTPPALRRLLAAEVRDAEALLDEGAELVGRLSGWARVAVAGYVAGGYATAAALRRHDFDVLGGLVRPRRRDVLTHLVRLLVRARPRTPEEPMPAARVPEGPR